MSELERQVRAWGQAVMRQGMAIAWAAQAPLRAAVRCPGWAGTASVGAGGKPRQLETLFGPVALPR